MKIKPHQIKQKQQQKTNCIKESRDKPEVGMSVKRIDDHLDHWYILILLLLGYVALAAAFYEF